MSSSLLIFAFLAFGDRSKKILLSPMSKSSKNPIAKSYLLFHVVGGLDNGYKHQCTLGKKAIHKMPLVSPSVQLSSVQFSRSVVSDSLQPHKSKHARPPCPSPTPGVHSDSCPLSQWCHPAISSSVVPFSSCPQSIPESDSFPMSQIFAWGGQSTGV